MGIDRGHRAQRVKYMTLVIAMQGKIFTIPSGLITSVYA